MVLGDSANDNDNHFIFQEADFEDENFNAASFVARYRRVAPLDSLKDQLRNYSISLKQQLYEIINRDYTNFIKIATKLDGIDVRVEKLRQPLVNLRMDTSSMNDLLLSSVKIINEKLMEKEKVRQKRLILDTCVQCLDSLSVAEEIVSPLAGRGAQSKSSGKRSRRQLLEVVARLKISSTDEESDSTNPYTVNAAVTRDIYNCSEYERAAHAVSFVRHSLDTLPQNASIPGHGALLRQLDQRCHQLIEQLVTRLRVRLSAMFAEDSSPSGRSFRHCVRAVEILGRGKVVCEAFAETITIPAIISSLSQGKVDSTGGRGSYAGLAECLQTVLANVTTKQTALFVTCEEMYSASNEKVSHSVDLVLDGVWSSVAAALVERFPGMFTVGIAGTFSRCYLAIENFLVGLAKVGGPNFQECISNRLAVHPKVREFQSKWRLPLYLQLRTQEITYRIDRICELSRTKGATHESINKIHTAQGTITAIPISNETASLKPSSVSVPTASSLQEIESTVTSTLSEEDIRSLSNSLNLERVFSCTLVRAFVLESSTCLHPKIALRPLGAKFLSLSLKIWARFEVHLCTLLSISMPSLESAVILSDGGEVPLKRLTSTGNLTQVQSSTSVLRIEDLMTLCKDVVALVVWLDSDYLEACKSYFHEVSMFEIIKSCVKSQSQKMNNFRGALWSHICALLTADCAAYLNGVNTVTARYRMTNKPAPTAPSAYIGDSFGPLRAFVAKYSAAANLCSSTPTRAWISGIIESICIVFRTRVQSLIDTVKSMDAALNKRSGRPKVANSSGMSDSDKILLQLLLDVQAFASMAVAMDVPIESIPSYTALLHEVQEGAPTFTNVIE